MNLVIVESPAKGKTIESYLGKDYKVVASYGHIRDLPKSKMGINTQTLEPEYVIPTKSRKQLTSLKKEAEKARKIILATDEDREGEAIAWHIIEALDLKNKKKDYQRIVFHEITKEAITNAIKNPREINQDLVDAQQARRVLDKLVGYSLSPVLWKKIRRGLSAGRVQSVAVKIIVDRENEIKKFKPEEFWQIYAELKSTDDKDSVFSTELIKRNDKKIIVKDSLMANEIEEEVKNAKFTVSKIEVREKKQSPPPPFITSSLQQEASGKLFFSAKKTMMIAQKLYEGKKIPGIGKEGLITYMRTDSLNLSEKAITEIREVIEKDLGKEFLPESPKRYKKKVKGAQEAHEAIRPTSALRKPEDLIDVLEPDELKLYDLIWKRAIASQSKERVIELTGIDFKAKTCTFRAKGIREKFPGFKKIYNKENTNNKEIFLPKVKVGEELSLSKLIKEQKFTQPPARYSESSLIKVMEEHGIGRPSTYAPTLSKIKERGYVRLENRYFIPEEIGLIVNEMLVNNFSKLVDIKFTATMEERLDDIAIGKIEWKEPIKPIWQEIEAQVKVAEEKIVKINLDEPTEEKCEKCSMPLIIKTGRFGKFYACSGFPECKNTKPYLEKSGQKCPECKDGDVVIKKTNKGKRTFWGCSNYPECKWASWTQPKNS